MSYRRGGAPTATGTIGATDPLGWGFPLSADPAADVGAATPNAWGWFLRTLGAGTITKMAVKVGTSSGNIDLGVLAPSGSGRSAVPGTLRGSSGMVACPAAGYAEVNLTGSVAVAAGDFLAVASSDATATISTSLNAYGGNGSPAFNLALGRYFVRTSNVALASNPTVVPTSGRVFILIGV